jgi:hypothetical protein
LDIQNIRRFHDTQSFSNPSVSNRRLLASESVSSGSCYSKAELQQACRDLEAYTKDLMPTESISSASGYFENKLVFAIRDWSASPGSQILHIEASLETKNAPITSEVSSCVVKALSDLNIPTVYLFCGWPSKSRENWMIRNMYWLISQLTEHLNVPEGGYLDFDCARLRELDGTIETWDDALSIFSDLLDYAPLRLYVIIDGIERLESMGGNEKYVSSLIRLLRDRAARAVLRDGDGRCLKVLLTTANSLASLNQLNDKALRTVTLNRQNAKRRPGEPRLGRSQIVLELENSAREM